MIIQIGTEIDESRILWKHNEKDEWCRADIDELIEVYERRSESETVDIINAIPSADTQTGWIPCSKKLPDKSGEYLVTRKWYIDLGGEPFVDILYYGKPIMPNRKVKGMCWYRSDDEWGDVVYDDDDVLAWMPLPKTYREE